MSHLHRRKALPWPDPGAIASAIASAIAAPFAHPQGTGQQQQETVTSYVYMTMSQTFDGPIAGYTTPGAPSVQPVITTSTPPARPATLTTDLGAGSPSSTAPHISATQASTFGSLPASILSPSVSVPTSVPLFSASSTIESSSSTSALSGAISASATQDPTISRSSDMTGGAKAGIAIGVILGIAAIASLVFFCIWQRRKAAKHQRMEDEKDEADNDPFFGSRVASTRTAPHLSLRPVTEFQTGFGGNRRSSQGTTIYPNVATAPVPMKSQASPSTSAGERPMNSNSRNIQNPFGNHAEAIDPVNAAGPSVVQGSGHEVEKMADGVAAATPGGAVANAAVKLTRGASKRGFGPNPLDLTQTLPGVGPASPASSEFSMTESPGTPTSGAAAIVTTGGPQNAPVHRVQLDFKPSMDDELELSANQLVRILHEYDDGWALCVLLDRSRQGVVPRTCLSTHPLRPRPQPNAGRNPSAGLRIPLQQQRHPMSPARNSQRITSPAGTRPTTIWPQFNPEGRPASPAGSRPSTAGGPHNPQVVSMPPNGRSSPSPAQMQDRRISPPGPGGLNSTGSPNGSPPNAAGFVGRKPVPGQAM